jgi:hypothetical protein
MHLYAYLRQALHSMCSCFRGLWRLFCGGGPARRGDKDAENHQEWGRGGVAGADDIEARERLLSNGDADSGRAPVQRPASRKESFALEGAAGADGPAVEDVPLPAPLAARPRSDSKQQQQAPRGEPPSARLSKGGLNAISAAAGDTGRAVTVMRHGHRQDELDATWSRVATRPWDPPLSIKGRSQVWTPAGGFGGSRVTSSTQPTARSCDAARAAGLSKGSAAPEISPPCCSLCGSPSGQTACNAHPLRL